MTADSKLYPAKIRLQCSSAEAVLEQDNNNLQATRGKIEAFVDDKQIESIAFDQLKEQCRNYLDVIDLMVEANDQDIDDYKTLSTAVGEEDLIGSVILYNKKHFKEKEERMRDKQREYENMAACSLDPMFAANYRSVAKSFEDMANIFHDLYLMWEAKERRYDEIEAQTRSLFANGIAVRSAIENLLGKIKLSFTLNTGYLPGMIEVSKMQADCIARGDTDTANGIRCLEEYMIQSGDFTAEQRVAMINEIVKAMPEKLRSLPNIISAARAEAGKVNMGEMVAKYSRYITGKRLIPPTPGTVVTISLGIDLEDQSAEVSSYDAWSIEYSIAVCNEKKGTGLCWKRLNYAINTYECNRYEEDLLKFKIDGYSEPVFAGAMVEGYADIGDIVEVRLDDGNQFKFLILDVKHTEHTSSQLEADHQCQCEWGHGYVSENNKVQLSICEFITAGSCDVDSAKDAPSGSFLYQRKVEETIIIDNIEIKDE